MKEKDNGPGYEEDFFMLDALLMFALLLKISFMLLMQETHEQLLD